MAGPYREKLLRHEHREHIQLPGHRSPRVALVYPNSYRTGIANLGFQWVYHIFSQKCGLYCERSFEREDEVPPLTVESATPLDHYELIAFSLSFELDYIRVIQILQRASIPLYARERSNHDPLLIAGGTCVTMNPEPLADIFDLLVIGEAEEVLPEVVRTLVQEGGKDRASLLREVAQIEGVYVPALYRAAYDDYGFPCDVEVLDPAPAHVVRSFVEDLERYPVGSSFVTSMSEFRDMYLVEVSRGCPWRCRFCLVSHLYHPFRWRSAESVCSQIRSTQLPTRRVGLVGAAVSDHPELDAICEGLVGIADEVGVSSFRIGHVSSSLLARLVGMGLQTLTLAPEAGSEWLREAIGKKMSHEQVLATAEECARSGIRSIRLYFMVGLPGEGPEESEAVVLMVRDLLKRFPGKVTVSINPMVPKPHTPFQYLPMVARDELTVRLERIRKELAGLPRVHVITKSPRLALLQALLSRGDRRMAQALVLRSKGSGWSKAFTRAGIDPEFYLYRERSYEERFPWDHIDVGVRRDLLWEECQKARGVNRSNGT
jgi:radical SAM superfamily enzyme YgiQ (UPF0313 family)